MEVILKRVAIWMQTLYMLRGSLAEDEQQRLASVEGGTSKHCEPHKGISGTKRVLSWHTDTK